MNNNSVNVPRLDREIERGLRQLDSVIDECIGNQSPFESVTKMSQEYLEDLQDGEQDKSKEHYQKMNASQFTLESTDEMTKGDLTDQMQRQEAELEQMREPDAPTAALNRDSLWGEQCPHCGSKLTRGSDETCHACNKDFVWVRSGIDPINGPYGETVFDGPCLPGQEQEAIAYLQQKANKNRAFLNREHYIRRGDKQLGPVSGERIVKNFQDGKVLVTDEISADPSGPWVVVSDSDMMP